MSLSIRPTTEVQEPVAQEAPRRPSAASPFALKSLSTRFDAFKKRAQQVWQGVFSPTAHAVTSRNDAYQQIMTKLGKHPEATPPESFTYTSSTTDKGGHGGTKIMTVPTEDGIYHLFLKPADSTEIMGYRNIAISDTLMNQNNRAQDKGVRPLTEFMTETHGTVTIDGQEYFIMDNICMTDKGVNPPEMDVKLSGLVGPKDGHCFIANQDEFKETRGFTKSAIDFAQMKLGAELAPDFMVYHPEKMLRLASFSKSDKVFIKKMETKSLEELKRLRQDLSDLRNSLSLSSVAFYGASILFLETGFKLIDPAHIQVDPSLKESYLEQKGGEADRTFFGSQATFDRQQASNLKSINALIHILDGLIEKKSLHAAPIPDDSMPSMLEDSEPMPDDTETATQAMLRNAYGIDGAIL